MHACMHVCCWSITAILVSASTDGSAQVTQGHGNSIPMKLAYYKSGKKKHRSWQTYLVQNHQLEQEDRLKEKKQHSGHARLLLGYSIN